MGVFFKNNLPTFLHVSGTAKLKFREGNFRCDDVPVLRVTVVSVSHGGFNQRKHIRNQPNQNQPSSYDLAGWCFQTFFIFTPKPWGNDSQLDESYFSGGLVQPPTSLVIERNQSTKKSTQGLWDPHLLLHPGMSTDDGSHGQRRAYRLGGPKERKNDETHGGSGEGVLWTWKELFRRLWCMIIRYSVYAVYVYIMVNKICFFMYVIWDIVLSYLISGYV